MRKNNISHIIQSFKNNFLLKLALFSFVFVAFTFNESGLMPLFAVVLTILFFLKKPYKTISRIRKYPLELKLLNLWVIWSFFTGVIVSKNYIFFINGYRTLLLLVLTVNLIFLILVYDISLLKYIGIAIFISALIQIVAIQFGFQAEEVLTKERQYGLSGNPNAFGLKMVYGSMAVLIVMGIKKMRINFKLILALFLLSIFLNGVFDSGSRKSALSFMVLILGFAGIYIVSKKHSFSMIKIVVPIFFAGLLLYLSFPILMEGTVLEQRFLMQEARGGIEGDIRYNMVTFGLELFADNPFFGVGINNYREYFYTGQYSHNDYIESLTSTGLLGFLLYQLFFIIPLIKSYKLSKIARNRNHRFYLLFSFLVIVTIKVIGLGIILYTSPPTLIIMACVVSYLYVIQHKTESLKLIS